MEEAEVREAEEAFRQWGREALVKHARQKLEEWKSTPVDSCKKCPDYHHYEKLRIQETTILSMFADSSTDMKTRGGRPVDRLGKQS